RLPRRPDSAEALRERQQSGGRSRWAVGHQPIDGETASHATNGPPRKHENTKRTVSYVFVLSCFRGSAGFMIEDLLARLERERLEADRLYNEALTAVDHAI